MIEKIKNAVVNFFKEVKKDIINIDIKGILESTTGKMVLGAVIIGFILVVFNMDIKRLLQGTIAMAIFYFVLIWRKE